MMLEFLVGFLLGKLPSMQATTEKTQTKTTEVEYDVEITQLCQDYFEASWSDIIGIGKTEEAAIEHLFDKIEYRKQKENPNIRFGPFKKIERSGS